MGKDKKAPQSEKGVNLIPVTGDTSNNTQAAQEQKLTIYEYEEKYVRRQNAKGAKLLIGLLAGVIGIFIGWCLFSFTMQLWNIHPYAGYALSLIHI